MTKYEYVYGVDVWEGSLDVDEGILKEAGVEFVIVRLNDMRGGHRVDRNFVRQWVQCDQFIRWPYFVYNPWVNGRTNFEFLAKNAPECGAVSIDIEVRYTGYSPVTYAAQVAAFLKLAGAKWNINIYTGQWFLPYLSTWPANYEYWWAQYPYALYPSTRTRISWPALVDRIAALKLFPVRSPGACRLRQVTADRYVLPGCQDRPVDINVWNGTLEELRAWAGGNPPLPPLDKGGEWMAALDAWARSMGYAGPKPD
jgi:GH25 family lysozyme M1 (1,4-beta-N-acetylmuramidase)